MTEHELKLDNQKSIDLDSLIEKGKQGKLSSDDLEEVVEEMDFDIESLDKLYDTLENNGITLPGDLSGLHLPQR